MNIVEEFENIIIKYNIRNLSFFNSYAIERHKLTGAVLIDNYDDYGRKIEAIDFYLEGKLINNKEEFLRKFKLIAFL